MRDLEPVTKPHTWAFHAYETGTLRSAVRFTRFATYANGVGGSKEFWLTEQGGRTNVVVPAAGGVPAHYQGTAAANADLGYLVHTLPDQDSHITRFYVYNYVGDIKGARGLFDSGLTDYRWTLANRENVPREMYCTYLNTTQQTPPACAADPRTADPIPYTPPAP